MQAILRHINFDGRVAAQNNTHSHTFTSSMFVFSASLFRIGCSCVSCEFLICCTVCHLNGTFVVCCCCHVIFPPLYFLLCKVI